MKIYVFVDKGAEPKATNQVSINKGNGGMPLVFDGAALEAFDSKEALLEALATPKEAPKVKEVASLKESK
jgi:hypothetical protein